MPDTWHSVSNPIQPQEHIPAERKTVLVFVRNSHLPFCAYIRYAAGDRDCPFFVVYHGNSDIGSDVLAWCDCLPDKGPAGVMEAAMYTGQQATGRGFPERLPPASSPEAVCDAVLSVRSGVLTAVRTDFLKTNANLPPK